MQIVSLEDSFHEMSKPVFWENKNNVINLSSAELPIVMLRLNSDTGWFIPQL